MLDVFDTLKQMRQDFQEDEKYHNEDSRKTKKELFVRVTRTDNLYVP